MGDFPDLLYYKCHSIYMRVHAFTQSCFLNGHTDGMVCSTALKLC